MVKTLAQARKLVRKVQICTIFPSEKVEHTSLWEHVDLPDKQPGETGWGKKMNAVWTWKTQLPAKYPDDVYYGKIRGGLAVLMDREYLEDTHFSSAYQEVSNLGDLAEHILAKVASQPWTTTDLRKSVLQDYGCTKSQFETALKKLQISMNIVRLNDPSVEQDTWVLFKELYWDVWQKHVRDA